MDFNKLNRYLYEIKRQEILDISKLSFDDILEKISNMCCEERETVIKILPEKTRNEILELIEGGLL